MFGAEEKLSDNNGTILPDQEGRVQGVETCNSLINDLPEERENDRMSCTNYQVIEVNGS